MTLEDKAKEVFVTYFEERYIRDNEFSSLVPINFVNQMMLMVFTNPFSRTMFWDTKKDEIKSIAERLFPDSALSVEAECRAMSAMSTPEMRSRLASAVLLRIAEKSP